MLPRHWKQYLVRCEILLALLLLEAVDFFPCNFDGMPEGIASKDR